MGVYAPNLPVPAPACQPPRFGLASVATIIDETDPHAQNGIRYQQRACVAPVSAWEPVCPPGPYNVKTPTDTPQDEVEGDPFTLYATRTCRTTTIDAMFDEVVEDFQAGEWRGIEREVWARLLAQPTATVLNTVAGPAGALSVTSAIAALESFMGQNYSCRALFHSDRGTVPYAIKENQLVVVGGQLNTFLGSAWAAYLNSPNLGPDGTPAPDGHAWIYATSALTLRRFPLDVNPGRGDNPLINTDAGQTNEPYVLAERTYVPSIECAVAAVLVCLGACE